MKDKVLEKKYFQNESTVYGPVKSWRFGQSLGIDPIFQNSICSFNCVYCQLGNIQVVTNKRDIYVATDKVLQDYKEFLKKNIHVDVITFSGNGEPTLASNIKEINLGIRELTPNIPQYILTNGTELFRDDLIDELDVFDKVILKIDAASDETLKKMNRSHGTVSINKIIEGAQKLRSRYQGSIETQTMFMPINIKEAQEIAYILKEISPDLIQLNTPKRPYPLEFHKENRGNHLGISDYETRKLQTVSQEQADEILDTIKTITQVEVISIYN